MVEHIEQAPPDDISAALERPKGASWRAALLATAGVLGAIGASTCCIIPFAFISVGMSGAWLGNVVALSPYQPFFVAIAVSCLAAGFYFVYRKPRTETCDADSVCAQPKSVRLTKSALWVGTLLVTAAIVYPYVAPLFIEF